jgi:hypothetical protein
MTTKDTKYHEGIDLQVFPSWDFVSFVVVVLKAHTLGGIAEQGD